MKVLFEISIKRYIPKYKITTRVLIYFSGKRNLRTVFSDINPLNYTENISI